MAQALRGVLAIGNHVSRRVVIRIQQRSVTLPDAFDARGLRDAFVMHGERFLRVPRRTAETLPRSVVHDDYLRLDGIKKPWRSSPVERSVATRLPDRDLAYPVDGTCQLHFLLPVEVGQIEELELPVREE